MAMVGIAILFSLVLCGFALLANARLKGVNRIPMQWWFNGEATWSAPRPVALAFFPVMAACAFIVLIFLAENVRPKVGQEGMVLPTFIGIGLMFLGLQLLHLWLVQKTLRRNGS
ncbi:hypothetical protein [Sphingomonas sp. PR090111-T3T-6A]|uniref:hypothetical protein n=1 Tax=Sphingomonas sp. PR090111-T3T-6A TaxID=685778 RepID=UPI000364EB4B|nr:hypothetical protein [Sphingomonas sp. PR090111-T3T-6A]